jgi:hypothetical protein
MRKHLHGILCANQRCGQPPNHDVSRCSGWRHRD